jgi:hypothetical protein
MTHDVCTYAAIIMSMLVCVHQIKYDTRIVAAVNGYLKMVLRDRAVIVAKDDASVTYKPRTAWDESALKAFTAEALDGSPPDPPADSLPKQSAGAQNSVTFAGLPSTGGARTIGGLAYPSIATSGGESVATAPSPSNGRGKGLGATASKAGNVGSSISVVETGSASSKVKDVFVSTQAQETQYSFNIRRLTCSIEVQDRNLELLVYNVFFG